jgi:putative molybdopterin biosynthesis protein
MMANQVYTPEEVASILKVSKNAIYKWVQEGRIDAIRIGKSVRIPAAEVERLLRGERSTRGNMKSSESEPGKTRRAPGATVST